MSVSIVKVSRRKDLRKFIDFPKNLYRDNPCWVPPLRADEFKTFNPRRNGAYEYCEAECFLAYRGKRIVGRVAAIINNRANGIWGEKTVRFGWFDLIDDQEVCDCLLNAVAQWGLERGCSTVKGPLGFTDMDKEGSLVEGYDVLCPFTCLYNYPYYDTRIKASGFAKDTDWTQKEFEVSNELPSVFKFNRIVESRYGLHVPRLRHLGKEWKYYGMEIFRMYNHAFAPLYEVSPLSERQMSDYINSYIPIVNPDYIILCLDRDGKPVGFIFCVPTLSKAIQKSGGRLFPSGIFRIYHALRHNDTLEALIMGVLPDYQGRGAVSLMIERLHENCIRNGIRRIIMNPQLESNTKVQTLFTDYNPTTLLRRRCYTRNISTQE